MNDRCEQCGGQDNTSNIWTCQNETLSQIELHDTLKTSYCERDWFASQFQFSLRETIRMMIMWHLLSEPGLDVSAVLLHDAVCHQETNCSSCDLDIAFGHITISNIDILPNINVLVEHFILSSGCQTLQLVSRWKSLMFPAEWHDGVCRHRSVLCYWCE